VVIITVDDPKEGSLNLASILDSVESVEAVSWPTPRQIRESKEALGEKILPRSRRTSRPYVRKYFTGQGD
jgi:hypothetical protein